MKNWVEEEIHNNRTYKLILIFCGIMCTWDLCFALFSGDKIISIFMLMWFGMQYFYLWKAVGWIRESEEKLEYYGVKFN